MPESLIRSVSDTARWVAYHRATESDRPDKIFSDPYARRLAGERGKLIAQKLRQNAWAIAVRTYLFDKMINALLSRERVEMVLNLAAGLDSRPYRLDLPSWLQWIEVDLPEILDAKREMLSNEKPRCQLEIIVENLAHETQRRALFSSLNERAQKILVVSEGLLIYLNEENVTNLSSDLYAQPNFQYWLIEVTSPKVLDWINRRWRHHFEAANSPMVFTPADWRKFYRERGWELVEFQELTQTAQEIDREPRLMKAYGFLAHVFPGWYAKQLRFWESGVALLRRA